MSNDDQTDRQFSALTCPYSSTSDGSVAFLWLDASDGTSDVVLPLFGCGISTQVNSMTATIRYRAMAPDTANPDTMIHSLTNSLPLNYYPDKPATLSRDVGNIIAVL
jgi:hypothetical protein